MSEPTRIKSTYLTTATTDKLRRYGYWAKTSQADLMRIFIEHGLSKMPDDPRDLRGYTEEYIVDLLHGLEMPR